MEMEKRHCECCLTEDDLIDLNEELVSLVYLCFSIQISSHFEKVIFICNICDKKLKDSNEFRCQILDSQTKLRKFHNFFIPEVTMKTEEFHDENFIKKEEILLSDIEDSTNIVDPFSQNQIYDENTNLNDFLDRSDPETKRLSDLKSEMHKKRSSDIKRNRIIKKKYQMKVEEKRKYNECLQYIYNKNVLDCGICNVKFSSHQMLVSHIAIHFPNIGIHKIINRLRKKVMCKLCNKKISIISLQKHMRLHSDNDYHYRCSICGEKFISQVPYFKYQESVPNKVVMKCYCKICSKTFYRKYDFVIHISSHCKTRENKKRVSCPECNKNVSSTYLLKHMKIVHSGYTCSICVEKFNSKIQLLKHKEHDHNIEIDKYHCYICSRNFYHKTNLEKHNLLAHCITETAENKHVISDENSFNCKICNAKFDSHKSLLSHRTLHSSFICETCGKPFSSKPNLVNHMKSHMEKQKISCTVCNKEIFSNSLNQHMKIHTGHKVHYKCSICGEEFTSQVPYFKHQESVHNKVVKKRHCEICSKDFYRKYDYVRHIRSHDETEDLKKVPCPECNKDISPSYLRQHIKLHNVHRCSICTEKFESSIMLNEHLKLIHTKADNEYRCHYCSKLFRLKSNLVKHTSSCRKMESGTTGEGPISKTSYWIWRNNRILADSIPFELKEDERNCRVCGENFASHKVLISHLAIHYPNFMCDKCGKPFLVRRALVTHLKVHKDNEVVSCTLCEKNMKPDNLKKHMKKMHCGEKVRYQCLYCEERFEYRHQRFKHMKESHETAIYKYHCNLCPKKFYLRNKIKFHIRACHSETVA